ncbi:MAG: hypothetical protein WC878_05350 [Candidatus Paceibacterota bacterium]|jgi:hypothetical protein
MENINNIGKFVSYAFGIVIVIMILLIGALFLIPEKVGLPSFAEFGVSEPTVKDCSSFPDEPPATTMLAYSGIAKDSPFYSELVALLKKYGNEIEYDTKSPEGSVVFSSIADSKKTKSLILEISALAKNAGATGWKEEPDYYGSGAYQTTSQREYCQETLRGITEARIQTLAIWNELKKSQGNNDAESTIILNKLFTDSVSNLKDTVSKANEDLRYPPKSVIKIYMYEKTDTDLRGI